MRVFWAALCVAVFACVYSFHVRANEPQGDTKEQVALFASLIDEKGPQVAMASVNEDAKSPTACVIAQVLFVVVENLDKVTIAGRPYVIAKILVGGVMTPAGLQPIQPQEFYTLFPDAAEGRPA